MLRAKQRMDLEELPLVRHGAQEVLDVVGLVGVLRDERVEGAVLAVGGVLCRAHRRVGRVVGGEEPHQAADAPERVDVVLAGEVGHARDLAVGRGPAEPLHRHVLMRHGADDLGAGDEHVARALRHEHEIGDRRRVHRAAGAGTEDRRDLRHHAGRDRVAQKDVGVPGKRDDALLDARSPGVVEADDRDAELEGEVHDLADLLGVGLRERTAEDREVLREHRGLPPVDAAEPGDHAVARDALALHPEVVAAVRDEAIDLVEAAGVEQEVEPLPGRELAGRVLLVDASLAAPVEARRLQVLQTLADVVAHVSPPNLSGGAGKRSMLSRRCHET